MNLARPEPLYTRPASAALAHAHDARPSSQLSAHTLHSSGRSRGHKPRPLGVIPYPGPGAGARYSALQGSGRQKHDQVISIVQCIMCIKCHLKKILNISSTCVIFQYTRFLGCFMVTWHLYVLLQCVSSNIFL